MTEPSILSRENLQRGRWLRNPDIWAPGLLVLLGILFFSDPLFSSKNFYFRDILNFHYPLRRILIESYAHGDMPLWNPFIYLGQPLLANPNYMAFYPTNLLHLFLPFNYAFKLHFILHPILAGIGLYFLQRRLGLSAVAALAGAVTYEFSGTVLSFLNLYNIIPAVALLPWIGWAFLRSLEKHWFRRCLGFGMLLALQVIAFEPLMFLCNVWFLCGLMIYHIMESDEKPRALNRCLRSGLVGSLFAVSLAAVQVFPTLELLPRSARGAGLEYGIVTGWSLHPLDLLNAIVPNLYGTYSTIGLKDWWGESMHNGRESYLVSFFLGAGTLLLAAVSFCSRRRRLLLVLACLTLVSLALALGRFNPVYRWLFDHLGLFRLGRYPSKYSLLTTLSISMMASLGLEALIVLNGIRSSARRGILAAGTAGLAMGCLLLGYWMTWPSHLTQLDGWIGMALAPVNSTVKNMPAILASLKHSVLASGVFFLLAGALILIALQRRRATLVSGLFLLLITAELLPANLRLTPLITDADVDFVPDVNKYLRQGDSKDLYRVVPPTLLRPMPDLHLQVPNLSSAWLTLFYRMSGQPYYGIMNGIQYSLERTVDYLGTMESEEFWKTIRSIPQPAALTLLAKLNSPMILSFEEMRDPRLRALASFRTMSDMDLNVYWLDGSISRALFAANVEIASSHDEAFRKFVNTDFPFGNTVILEDPARRARSGPAGAGSAAVERYGNDRVTCRVASTVPGYLVLLDSYYPGWNAYVDGKRSEVLRADYAFRAVAVPEGHHIVEFRFRPESFYRGLAVSSIAILIGIFAAAVPFVRRIRGKE